MVLVDQRTGGVVSGKEAEILRFNAMPRPELLGMEDDNPRSHIMSVKRFVQNLGDLTRKYANEEDVAIYLVL